MGTEVANVSGALLAKIRQKPYCFSSGRGTKCFNTFL
jgi:hypothetical protein